MGIIREIWKHKSQKPSVLLSPRNNVSFVWSKDAGIDCAVDTYVEALLLNARVTPKLVRLKYLTTRPPTRVIQQGEKLISYRKRYDVTLVFDLDSEIAEAHRQFTSSIDEWWINRQLIAEEFIPRYGFPLPDFDKLLAVNTSFSYKSNEFRVNFKVRLIINSQDIVGHFRKKFLSPHLHEQTSVTVECLNSYLQACPSLASLIYSDDQASKELFDAVEAESRAQIGIPQIGDFKVTESLLSRIFLDCGFEFSREYSPSWMGRLRCDFYFPNLDLVIEYNGKQHYEPVEIFGGYSGLKKTRQRDREKLDLCVTNGITVIYWPYTVPVRKDLAENLQSCLQLIGGEVSSFEFDGSQLSQFDWPKLPNRRK